MTATAPAPRRPGAGPGAPTLKLVVFDVGKTVLDGDGTPVPGVVAAIAALRRAGIKVALVQNEADATLRNKVTVAGVGADFVVGRTSAKASKPSPRFVQIPADAVGAAPREVLYVGDDDKTDALCAVNAGVLYLAARWANPQAKYGLPVDSPEAVLRFVFRFFGAPPRWYWTLERADALGRAVHVRALLPASRGDNALKDVVKLGRDLRVEGVDYWGFLSRRLLTGLVADGVVADVDTWAWVPSSDGAAKKPRFLRAFDLAARVLRDAHAPGLLVRHRPSVKQAYARWRGETPTFQNQVRTMHLNPALRSRVAGKHVLVADDFCTEGLSFEWSRNLLLAAGARAVTLVAYGRYRDEYAVFTPKAGRRIDPWAPSTLGDDDFDRDVVRGVIDSEAATEFQRLLRLTPPGTAPTAAR